MMWAFPFSLLISPDRTMRPPVMNYLFGLLVALLVSSVPVSAQGTMEKAGAALKNGEYAVAAELYSSVIEKEPENGFAVYNRALCYLALKEKDKALPDLNRAVELIPNDAHVYYNRGSVFVDKKEFDRAIADLSKSIELDSLFAPSHFMRGYVYLLIGGLPEGVRDLKQFVSIGKSDGRVELAKGLLEQIGFGPINSEVAAFTDTDKNITVQLPKDWYLKINDDGKTLNLFVSQQEVKKETDIFSVGVTIRRIRRMSKTFEGVESDGAWLAGFWAGANEEAAKEYHYYKVLSSRDFKVGDFVGVLREVELQQKKELFRVKMYEMILGYNDDVVTMNLEAPALLFNDYQSVFMKALESIHIEK
jgi:tetratricopeptide (TPR) repeat protein